MKNRDLTQGSLSLHLLRLAFPLMLGNILQQMYNTIASLVVNRYAGALEYAATGVSSSVMNLFLFIVIGACTGISVLFSQEYGAGDLAAFRRQHFISLVFGLGATAVISVVSILCLPALLRAFRKRYAEDAKLTEYTLFMFMLAMAVAAMIMACHPLIFDLARNWGGPH